MSPTLNGSSVIRRFKGSDAIEICNGITFDFYMGLPHVYTSNVTYLYSWSFVQRQEVIQECLIGLFVKERKREAGRERLGEEYVHIDGGAICTCTCNESVKVPAHSGSHSGMHRLSAFLQHLVPVTLTTMAVNAPLL